MKRLTLEKHNSENEIFLEGSRMNLTVNGKTRLVGIVDRQRDVLTTTHKKKHLYRNGGKSGTYNLCKDVLNNVPATKVELNLGDSTYRIPVMEWLFKGILVHEEASGFEVQLGFPVELLGNYRI